MPLDRKHLEDLLHEVPCRAVPSKDRELEVARPLCYGHLDARGFVQLLDELGQVAVFHLQRKALEQAGVYGSLFHGLDLEGTAEDSGVFRRYPRGKPGRKSNEIIRNGLYR